MYASSVHICISEYCANFFAIALLIANIKIREDAKELSICCEIYCDGMFYHVLGILSVFCVQAGAKKGECIYNIMHNGFFL